MNILFLDIEGVLSSIRSGMALNHFNCKNGMCGSLGGSTLYPVEFTQDYFKFDPIAIALLRYVVEKYDFKIVVSSSQRVWSSLEHFNQMFKCYGWDTSNVLIGFTPVCLTGFRGDDIEQFIMENNLEAEQYIILDDCDLVYERQKERLVQTSLDVGLSVCDVQRIEQIMELADGVGFEPTGRNL